MRLTIKDVAKMAGVSPGTVSKVINKTGSISAETAKKVDKIIVETGYRPSFSAKSLATKKSNLIGLIFHVEFSHPFFNEIVNSFKVTIGELGYDMLVFSRENFSNTKEDYIAKCQYFQLDGCVIISGEELEPPLQELDESDIPCVGIDIELKGPKSSYVSTDNHKVSSKVVEYLYLHSIKEVAFIGGPSDSIVSNIRKNAFLHYLDLFGMVKRPNWIQYGDYFEESGYQAMKRILASSPYPQVVYAASDMMAFGALKALKEEGILVPEEIKLIGCDDIEATRYSNPPLATVKQDRVKMGKLAAYMLHDLISGNADSFSILVDPQLIIRESCTIGTEITIPS
ncbi:transcriptional regulator, LacI family [Gracilibacillus ureilyticus]|uniref:Transcriptional regulator, LacI family n=1 Tax=Gracilibacillus ureilyticus TaxID=531814 RepID=A0A1H9VRF7_9BACI|nr:LacI family DNA-binding transcriptional regulator [Gracilibacillus ureilyticus]SES23957.1 transcriptional regulator, LacI family [Gracilibacillus ureilyticus]